MIPTEPGYYWHRDIDEGCGEAFEWEPKHVTRTDPPREIMVADFLPVAEVPGEWGPRISDPDELQQETEDRAALKAAIDRSVRRASNLVRDSLAVAALPACVMQWHDLGKTYADKAAQAAYEYADAMMAEREKRNA